MRRHCLHFHHTLFIIIIIILILIPPQTSAQPNKDNYVLVISLDGFRWDYANRNLTPNLDQIAQRGVKALSLEPAFPSKTFPNHYTIVTGLYPQNHGIISNRFENPFNKDEYRIGDTSAVRDDRWYLGESIWAKARREGIKTASFFWVGSETHLPYKHPDYYRRYDDDVTHEQRIQGIIDWLQLPETQRPHLLFLYFSDTDTEGHRHGPESAEVNEAVKKLDASIGSLLEKLKQINLSDKTNLIMLSDHGMTNVFSDRAIDVAKFLKDVKVKVDQSGPVMQLFLENKAEIDRSYQALKSQAQGFQVFKRTETPEYFHYKNNPFIGDIILLAELGGSLAFDEGIVGKVKRSYSKGDHGYDPRVMDMQGIFFAAGPAFKENYHTGTLRNVDIFPLIVEIMGMTRAEHIDGDLERIGQVLR